MRTLPDVKSLCETVPRFGNSDQTKSDTLCTHNCENIFNLCGGNRRRVYNTRRKTFFYNKMLSCLFPKREKQYRKPPSKRTSLLGICNCPLNRKTRPKPINDDKTGFLDRAFENASFVEIDDDEEE